MRTAVGSRLVDVRIHVPHRPGITDYESVRSLRLIDRRLRVGCDVLERRHDMNRIALLLVVVVGGGVIVRGQTATHSKGEPVVRTAKEVRGACPTSNSRMNRHPN